LVFTTAVFGWVCEIDASKVNYLASVKSRKIVRDGSNPRSRANAPTALAIIAFAVVVKLLHSELHKHE